MLHDLIIHAVNDTKFAQSSKTKEDYSSIASNSVCIVFAPINSEMQVRLQTVSNLELIHKSEADKIRLTPTIQIFPVTNYSSLTQPLIIELMNTVTLKQSYKDKCSLFLYSCQNPSVQNFKKVKLNASENMQNDRISFQTAEFGHFAVVAHFPPPSSTVTLQPNGNSEAELEFPEVSGLKVYIPSNSINCTSPLDIKATTYYCDPFTTLNDETTLASPCISLEPHGLSLLQAVTVTFLIPDWEEIRKEHPNIELQLWYSPGKADSPEKWSILEEAIVTITRDSSNKYFGSFTISHFSSFMVKFKQTINRGIMTLFSSKLQSIKRRCQVFMTKDRVIHNPNGDIIDFAIAVVILPFETDRASTAPQGYDYYKLSDSGDEPIEFNSDTSCFSAKVHLSTSLFSNAAQEQLLQNKQAKLPEDLDSSRRVEFHFTPPYVTLNQGTVLGQLIISQSSNDSSTPVIIKDCYLIKVGCMVITFNSEHSIFNILILIYVYSHL